MLAMHTPTALMAAFLTVQPLCASLCANILKDLMSAVKTEGRWFYGMFLTWPDPLITIQCVQK